MSNYESIYKLSLIIQPFDFISNICQRQKQHSLKTRIYCLRRFQSTESQEQQRNKRVGWTISV